MKQNLKAWLGAFALLLMVGVATLTFAFKAEPTNSLKKRIPTSWYFIGDELNDATIASVDNWTTEDPELGCGLGEDVPCELVVEDAPDLTSLQTFLNGKTAVQIRDTYAESQRAE